MSNKKRVTNIWVSDYRKQKSYQITPKFIIEVSDDGNLWMYTPKGVVHKTEGAITIPLATGGRNAISVDSVILQTFSDTIPDNIQIKHLDGNKSNCRIDNMSFVNDLVDITLKITNKRPKSIYTYDELIQLCNTGIEVWTQVNDLFLRNSETSCTKYTVKSKVEVSNMGNVRVRRYNRWTLVSDITSTKRTPHLRNKFACTIGKSICFFRHQIVMQSFFPNDIPSLLLIDHMDRNPSNNKISNLRWTTFKQNSNNKGNQIDMAILKRIEYLEQLLNENNISFN